MFSLLKNARNQSTGKVSWTVPDCITPAKLLRVIENRTSWHYQWWSAVQTSVLSNSPIYSGHFIRRSSRYILSVKSCVGTHILYQIHRSWEWRISRLLPSQRACSLMFCSQESIWGIEFLRRWLQNILQPDC